MTLFTPKIYQQQVVDGIDSQEDAAREGITFKQTPYALAV